MKVQFTNSDLKKLGKAFDALARKGRDTAPLMDAFGQTLVDSSVHRLAVTNESPDGEKWPTSARARAKGTPTQYKSGTAGLAGSLTHASGSDSVEWGSALPYAAQRQFGGTIRAKNGDALKFSTFDESGEEIFIVVKQVTQPARPYLGISADDEFELEGLALDFFNDAVTQ